MQEKLYSFSNLIIYNPFFHVMQDNLYCAIVFCHYILLIVCFCPSMSCSELFSFNSSSISQFEFLMQWHFIYFLVILKWYLSWCLLSFLIMMNIFHIMGKPKFSILVLILELSKWSKISYVQCLHFGRDLHMFLRMFLTSKTTLC